MGSVAQILFLITLVGDFEPRVTWVFFTESCGACRVQQLELMKEFLDSEDAVVLYTTNNTRKTKESIKDIKKIFPDIEIIEKSEKDSCQITTGWIWEDSSTKEEVIYNSRSGTYSIFRSRALLKMIR
jgi:hypothetical protein